MITDLELTEQVLKRIFGVDTSSTIGRLFLQSFRPFHDAKYIEMILDRMEEKGYAYRLQCTGSEKSVRFVKHGSTRVHEWNAKGDKPDDLRRCVVMAALVACGWELPAATDLVNLYGTTGQ